MNKTHRRLAFLLGVFLLVAATLAAAQKKAPLSPAATADITLSGNTIRIAYSAPSVRGRQIFGPGGLVSKDQTYPVWRAGANSATAFHTDAALNLGGLNVPKGDYTLFVLVQDPAHWLLIVNKQTKQWGLTYDPKQDLGRVPMSMSTPPTPVERLSYTFAKTGARQAQLTLSWDGHVASVPVTLRS